MRINRKNQNRFAETKVWMKPKSKWPYIIFIRLIFCISIRRMSTIRPHVLPSIRIIFRPTCRTWSSIRNWSFSWPGILVWSEQVWMPRWWDGRKEKYFNKAHGKVHKPGANNSIYLCGSMTKSVAVTNSFGMGFAPRFTFRLDGYLEHSVNALWISYEYLFLSSNPEILLNS